MRELHIYFQNKKAFQFAMNQPQIIVGRSAESDLILSGETVSRRHAIISQQNNTFWIEDFSAHGTILNGEKITVKTKISDGDVVRISEWELKMVASDLAPNSLEATRQTQISEITKHLPTQPTSEMVEFSKSQNEFRSTFPLLMIQNSLGTTSRVIMKKKTMVLGTSKECDVVLDDEFVSSRHCRLTSTDRGFLIEDLDSTNGTWVDHARVQQICINETQKLKIGKTEILISLKSEQTEPLKPIRENVFCKMVGSSEIMRLLFSKIQKIAATDMTTLILGETGVGKELVARAIHDLSPRRGQPYVVINCGAISPQLIESELFGHEKGAFTGAEKQHKGVFEQAHQGTLFLDEVGELPLDLQAKVLRVLEYKTLRRVGGDTEVKVDVRVIAATHRNLNVLVSTQKFREDLFYRLYVLPLQIPSLRERMSDVVLIAQNILQEHASKMKLSPQAIQKLEGHNWPGNVRELKNTLLRALAFCDGETLEPKDIEFLKFEPTKPAVQKTLLGPDEKQQIVDAIQKAGGDKEKAAEALGISRATLFRKLKKFEE